MKNKRDFENNVFFEVWRSGGDPDAIDFEEVGDDFCNGYDEYESAGKHIGRERRRRENEQ